MMHKSVSKFSTRIYGINRELYKPQNAQTKKIHSNISVDNIDDLRPQTAEPLKLESTLTNFNNVEKTNTNTPGDEIRSEGNTLKNLEKEIADVIDDEIERPKGSIRQRVAMTKLASEQSKTNYQMGDDTPQKEEIED